MRAKILKKKNERNEEGTRFNAGKEEDARQASGKVEEI